MQATKALGSSHTAVVLAGTYTSRASLLAACACVRAADHALIGYSEVALQVENSIERVQDALKRLYKLAQGGTAVGTGLNTKVGFAEKFADAVAEDTGA